jgi:type VI secretion system protein VasD
VRIVNAVGPRNLAAFALLLLASCAGPPPPPPPTIVNVRASATSDINVTSDGQGAPVVTRIYQLASKTAFDGAEFFPLYKADAATLGPDLIKKDEFLLVPGSTKTVTLMPVDAVHHVGVFGAFRDFQNVNWRAFADIPSHQTTAVTVTVDRAGIKLVAKPASP